MPCNLPVALWRALPLALVSQTGSFDPCLRAGAMSGGFTQAGEGLGHKYGVPQRAWCSGTLQPCPPARSSSPTLIFFRTTTSTRRRHCRLLWLCLSPRTEGCRGASLRFGPLLTPLLHTRPSRWGGTGLVAPWDPPPLFPLLSGLIPPPGRRWRPLGLTAGRAETSLPGAERRPCRRAGILPHVRARSIRTCTQSYLSVDAFWHRSSSCSLSQFDRQVKKKTQKKRHQTRRFVQKCPGSEPRPATALSEKEEDSTERFGFFYKPCEVFLEPSVCPVPHAADRRELPHFPAARSKTLALVCPVRAAGSGLSRHPGELPKLPPSWFCTASCPCVFLYELAGCLFHVL